MKIAIIAVCATLGGCGVQEIANKPLAQLTLADLAKFVGVMWACFFVAWLIWTILNKE